MLLFGGVLDLRLGRESTGAVDATGIAVALALTIPLAWGLGRCVIRIVRSGVAGEAVRSTARITAMVFTIIIGAQLFSLVFRGLGGDETVARVLTDMPGAPWARSPW